MFAISPRYSDDSGLFCLAEDLVNPWNSLKRYSPMLGEASISSRESEIQNTDKEFRIRLDLRNFKPEEVKITSDNEKVSIHAKHEEKQDNHGYVSREMTRVYKLPKDVDTKSVTSTMNSQGILNVKSLKKFTDEAKETNIPVEFKA